MNIIQRISRLLDVPSTDPEDARRRKLLNIILSVFIVLGILLLLYLVYLFFSIPRVEWKTGASGLFGATVGLLAFSILLFVFNRFLRGWITSGLFLILLTIGIMFGDDPAQLVAGRSVFLFIMPIILAGVLMPSWATIAAAGLDMAIMSYLAYQLHDPTINLTPTYLGLAFIVLLAWLSSRSVEVSLRDLRKLNRELDQRVALRTKELAEALSRERIESGQIKAILESIADGVLVFDLDGRSIIANSSLLSLLDMQYGEAIGTNIKGLIQSKYLDTFNRGLLNNILSNPSAKANNYHIQWGKKDISVTSAPVLDRDGDSIGTVAVFRDYTHEAEVEKMKTTFLAIVSHELRTPLNAIMGYAEMLKEAVYGPVNDKQTRASERIMSNSHRLLDIVSDLLDKAQMEAGKLSLHLQSFRPADLVENVHSVMDKIAADKNLSLTSELDPGLPEYLVGDIARLQQIMVNLITNSVKFTEKGSVHLCVSRSDPQHWMLKIIDSGIGISAEDLPTIFEAFHQVDGSTTRKHGGFGLGLSIVKQLSELMDGEVSVESTEGVGSSFSILLPLIQSKRSEQ